jgi:tellurite resistance protein TehA-like permease
MKFFTLIFTLLMTSQAFAHTDHVLGEGALHLFYHALFWGGFAFVAVKLVSYFMKKRKQNVDN